jgi:peptide/nickel transport system substrate-binding protein
VNASVQLLSAADYSTALAGHDYDATLHGISIGNDPDVYAFWHSSQADVRSNTRLNLSEWKNTTADAALEAGRTRFEPALRTIKYAPFLQAWQQEAPALGLYQPRYLYLTRGTVYGLTDHSIAGSIGRYNGVENWQIRTAKLTQK